MRHALLGRVAWMSSLQDRSGVPPVQRARLSAGARQMWQIAWNSVLSFTGG